MKVACIIFTAVIIFSTGCSKSTKKALYSDILVNNNLEPVRKDVIWADTNQIIYYFNKFTNNWKKLSDQIIGSDNPSTESNISQEIVISERNREYINAKKIGAKGNGKTNDSQAIQNAIDLCFQNGKALYVPKGTYIVKNLELNVSIYAEEETIFKLPKNANSYLANISGENLKIENLIFDGNVEDQIASSFNENYSGFAKNSLLQSFYLFDNLLFKNCHFQNTAFGAIAFVPISFKSVRNNYSFRNSNGIAPKNKINSCIFQSCTFEEIGTEAIRFTPHLKTAASVKNKEIVFPGSLIIQESEFRNVGSYTSEKRHGKYSHGDCILASYLNTVEVKNCLFYNSARYDIKLGLVNNITSSANKSYNACWGHLEVQSQYFHPEINVLPGKISLEKNWFFNNRSEGSSLFAQFKGSKDDTPNHALYPQIDIKDNLILYLQPVNPDRQDCILLSGLGNYQNISVNNNFCYGVHRGFIGISRSIKRFSNIGDISIINNHVIGKKEQGTSANSLLYIQSKELANGNVGLIEIKENNIEKVQTGIYLDAISVQLLIVNNNTIQSEKKYFMYYQGEKSKIVKSDITGNQISGKSYGFTPTIFKDNIIKY